MEGAVPILNAMLHNPASLRGTALIWVNGLGRTRCSLSRPTEDVGVGQSGGRHA
jgi:hypothetical protein